MYIAKVLISLDFLVVTRYRGGGDIEVRLYLRKVGQICLFILTNCCTFVHAVILIDSPKCGGVMNL